jgi:hypothetical protein
MVVWVSCRGRRALRRGNHLRHDSIFDSSLGRISHPPWVIFSPAVQHPSDNPSQWPDRRWTSTVAGTVSIQGHVAKAAVGGGDGTIARIWVAGVEIWNATLAFNDAIGTDFDLSAEVQVGTTVDFLVDPNTNALFDSTTLTAVISR